MADIENTVPKECRALRLIRSAQIDGELEAMTNEEIADLLLNRVWANMDILSTESAIVSAAIDKLREVTRAR